MYRIIFFFLAFFSFSNASSLHNHPALSLWQRSDIKPDPNSSHRLLFFLKQNNLEELDSVFHAVTNPSSSKYGSYLSLSEITQLIGVDDHILNNLISELRSFGATDIRVYKTRDALSASFPVSKVEEIFKVELEIFQHPDERKLIRSLTLLTLPENIGQYIDLVKGVNDLPLLRPRVKEPLVSLPHHKLNEEFKPIVQSALFRSDVFELTFVPVCRNGEVDENIPPCDKLYSERLYKGKITLAPMRGGSNVIEWDFDDITNDCSNGVCKITKMHTLHKSLMYTPFKVSFSYESRIRSRFYDVKRSANGYNKFPVVLAEPVTPANICKYYNIPYNSMSMNTTNSASVVEFEQQYYSPSDLINFMKDFGLPLEAAQNVNVIGPNTPKPGDAGVEANLDIQYLLGINPNINTTFWSIKADSSEEIDDILSWALAIGSSTNPPLVSSLSYGMDSENVDKYLGKGYLNRSDIEFKKLAVLGLTVIISSGDTGAGGTGPEPMSIPNCDKLHPDWPSQSPYVTAVSSTFFTTQTAPICYLPYEIAGDVCSGHPVGEVAASLDQGILFTGGGGFADTTPTAFFQVDEVNTYIRRAKEQDLLPPDGIWNPKGRAYPDVSAVGHNCMVNANGVYVPVDGTSASAPIFAAVISLLNDYRLNNNKPPLGFLNPLLYQIARDYPEAFYDVTVGNNRGGSYGTVSCDKAFSALPGWDPVTGLGTPNFKVLAKIINNY